MPSIAAWRKVSFQAWLRPAWHVLARVTERVGDDLGEVAVDDLVHRGDQRLVAAVLATHVEHVRPGGHRVDGLDVERLLAVPALGVALVVLGHVEDARRDDLAELHRRQTVLARVRVRVLLDRRRREGVDDRNRLAGAVVAAGDRLRGAVGALELARHVAAGGVGLEASVRRRLVVRDLLPPEGRAGRRVDERWARRCARDVTGRRVRGRVRLEQPVAAVKARHACDLARDRGGHREVAARRGQRLPGVAVGADLGRERLLDLRHVAGGLQPAVVVRHVRADAHALSPQPVAHGPDVGVRGRVAGVELAGREVLAVARAGWVADGRDRLVELLRVAHVQVDPEGLRRGVGHRAHLARRRGPVGPAVAEGAAPRRGAGGGGQSRRHDASCDDCAPQ